MMQDLFSRGIDTISGKLRPAREEAPELYRQTPLGWMPKDWTENTIGEISVDVTSGSRNWAQYYCDQGALFIRIGNLTREHVNFRFDDVVRVNLEGVSEGTRTKLKPGDLLISITADLGITAVMNESVGHAYVNQHIAVVRPDGPATLGRFLGHFYASELGQMQFRKYDDPGAKAGLNLPAIRSLLCYLPKEEEYGEIANKLDTVDRYLESLKRELQKHQFEKMGLMHDLLSG